MKLFKNWISIRILVKIEGFQSEFLWWTNQIAMKFSRTELQSEFWSSYQKFEEFQSEYCWNIWIFLWRVEFFKIGKRDLTFIRDESRILSNIPSVFWLMEFQKNCFWNLLTFNYLGLWLYIFILILSDLHLRPKSLELFLTY